jgi:hypothetical protein
MTYLTALRGRLGLRLRWRCGPLASPAAAGRDESEREKGDRATEAHRLRRTLTISRIVTGCSEQNSLCTPGRVNRCLNV